MLVVRMLSLVLKGPKGVAHFVSDCFYIFTIAGTGALCAGEVILNDIGKIGKIDW